MKKFLKAVVSCAAVAVCLFALSSVSISAADPETMSLIGSVSSTSDNFYHNPTTGANYARKGTQVTLKIATANADWTKTDTTETGFQYDPDKALASLDYIITATDGTSFLTNYSFGATPVASGANADFSGSARLSQVNKFNFTYPAASEFTCLAIGNHETCQEKWTEERVKNSFGMR